MKNTQLSRPTAGEFNSTKCVKMKHSYESDIELLVHQIELEESNYKYAVELKKDYNTLRRMRNYIRELKQTLQEKLEHFNVPSIQYWKG